METLDKIVAFLKNAKSFSITKKVLLILAIIAALAYALTSCTSMRSMSVSVEKAEKVNVNLLDSINSTIPL